MVLGIRTDICCWVGYGIAAAELLTEAGRAKYSQADLGSAMPTSGGLYWWTNFFSSPATRKPLCFLVGYSNTLGLVGGLCSIDCRSSAIFFRGPRMNVVFFDIHGK